MVIDMTKEISKFQEARPLLGKQKSGLENKCTFLTVHTASIQKSKKKGRENIHLLECCYHCQLRF